MQDPSIPDAAPPGPDAEEIPPPIETDLDLWEPAGEPDSLERAAAAWEAAAERLAAARTALAGKVSTVRWSGDARAALDRTWAEHAAALLAGEEGARAMAAQLRQVAQQIRQTNQEIQAIYKELAIDLGVTVVAGLVSFGAGAFAAAARAAVLVKRATRLKRALRLFLRARRAALAAVRASRISRFAFRFTAGAAESAVAEFAAKPLVEGGNPLDVKSWDAGDALAILAGGAINPAALRGGLRLEGRLTRSTTGRLEALLGQVPQEGPIPDAIVDALARELGMPPARFRRLATDPNRGLGAHTIREAVAAAWAERRGDLGRVQRSLHVGADFVDVERPARLAPKVRERLERDRNLQQQLLEKMGDGPQGLRRQRLGEIEQQLHEPVDHKTIKPGFDLERELDRMELALRQGERVLADVADLTPADLRRLRRAVEQRWWDLDDVVWFPR